MAEISAKKRLQEVSQLWNPKITLEKVLGIYKNSEKYTLERQLSFLTQLFQKSVKEFDKHQAQFETDVKKNKKTPYEAFIIFLNNIAIIAAPQKPQIAAKPKTSSPAEFKVSIKSEEFESPALSGALCSTRVENNNEIIVSEVGERSGIVTVSQLNSVDFL